MYVRRFELFGYPNFIAKHAVQYNIVTESAYLWTTDGVSWDNWIKFFGDLAYLIPQL